MSFSSLDPIKTVKPPLMAKDQLALSNLIEKTASGGSEAINKHIEVIRSDNINCNQIILVIYSEDLIIGWMSFGANYDLGLNESVIRIYLDFIYIKPEFRSSGSASIAINNASKLLARTFFVELPDLGEKVIPLDFEVSATCLNIEGESCVNLFGRSTFNELEFLLSSSSFLLREYVSDYRLDYE